MSATLLLRAGLVPALCVFLSSGHRLEAVPPAQEPDFTWATASAEEEIKIIGSHAQRQGIVVEGLDGQEILDPATYARGFFHVRVSNPTTSEQKLIIRVSVAIPDDSGLGKVPLPVDASALSAEIAPGKTRLLNFPFKLSSRLWDLLCKRTAGFGLSTLDFFISATTEDGTEIKPLVDVAHIGYAPARTAPLPPPNAIIRTHQGVPMLEINGRVEPSNFAYVGWNWGIARQTIREFAAADRHLYRIVFQPWSLWQNGKLDPDRFERRMNELITSIVGNDPQALIYVFWWLHTPKDWPDHFPGQTIVYDDGTDATPHPQPDQRGWRRPSMSSEIWRTQQDAIMREAARRLLDSPYADRIFGVSAGYGNGGEWNGYGYHGARFSDYSEPARKEFQEWLKSEYKTLGALNQAWGGNHHDWREIKVPDRNARLLTGWGSFTGPDFPQSVTDYHRFVSWQTVGLVEHYCELFKEASAGRWLTGVFYGYFSSHLTQPPYHALDSGHFALGRLLKSNAVDFISYPYGYMDRRRNLALGNAIASVQAAGKLYVIECDLATHLNQKSNAPILAHHEGGLHDPASTLVAFWRDFSRISTGGLSAWWYDFGRGWYLFPGWTDFVRRVERTRAWQREHSQASVAEVAVILDEEGAFFSGPQSAPYGRSLYDTLSYELDEAGAPWEAFLATDIDLVLQRNFKVIILLNPIAKASTLAAKLDNVRASIVWGYGSGLLAHGKWNQKLHSTGKTPGMSINPNKQAGRLTYAPTVSPIRIPGTVMQRLPHPGIFPRVEFDDTQGEPLAHYEDGVTAITSMVRSHDGRTDYWLGTPQLEKRLLATIYEKANVHRYTRDGSATYANASSVSVWRQSGGRSQVFLPQKAAEVIDAWTGEVIAQNTKIFDVPDTPGQSTAKLYLFTWNGSHSTQ